MPFMTLVFVIPVILFCTLALPVSASSNTQSHNIEILVIKEVIKKLPEFLQDKSIDKIAHFDRPEANRDIVDYILLRQALAIGLTMSSVKPVPTISVVPWHGASYNRLTSNLKRGQYTVFSNTLWREDFISSAQNTATQSKDALYISSPTLRYGEFEAGLYMNPSNPKFQQSNERFNISDLRAVSSSQWRPDWQALKQLPLKQVYDEVNWESMLKMVQSQRADFMLIPFSRKPDLSINALGIRLMPIHGVKMALAGSRGWAVSRTNAMGELTYNAIELGLHELHIRGVIPRAYQEAGVINSKAAHWNTVNTPAPESTSTQITWPQATQQ